MALYDNELLIEVESLNVDSASFTQMATNYECVAERIVEIVAQRGKLHNPETGSGGMLIGRVKQIGPRHPAAAANRAAAEGNRPEAEGNRPEAKAHEATAGVNGPAEAANGRGGLKIGDRIASLVSLSLTPLKIEEIKQINPQSHQVEIEGEAILFASSLYAKLPTDLPKALALAVLDVCGAPAQTAKLTKPGDTVVVLGAGGKSGLLCLHEAKKKASNVIALEYDEQALQTIKDLNLADHAVKADATDPIAIKNLIQELTNNEMADLTLSNVNVPGAELSAILATKQTGTIYFFSMATSFTKAALGAEGVGSAATMLIGNGYTPGHAELALNILRENEGLRRALQMKGE